MKPRTLLLLLVAIVFLVPALRDAYFYYTLSVIRLPSLVVIFYLASLFYLEYVMSVSNIPFVVVLLTTFIILPFGPVGVILATMALAFIDLFGDLHILNLNMAAVLLLLVTALALSAIFTPMLSYRLVQISYLDSPPTIYGNARVAPLAVAGVQVSDHIQNPAYGIHLGDAAVYYINKAAYYAWIVEPRGFWNRVTKHPIGIVVVNASVYPIRYRFVNISLELGLHTLNGLEPAYLRVAADAGYIFEPDMSDPIVTPRFVAVPVLWVRHGLLTTIPVVAGYVSLSDNRYISLSKVRRLAPEAPLVPASVARAWAEAATYSVGVLNVIMGNTWVIRDIGNNTQPYLLPVKINGTVKPMWVFIAESARSHAAVALILVDPYKTSPHVYIYKFKRPMMSFSRADDYILQAHPSFDWQRLTLQDPVPIFINDTLWWKVAVCGRGLRSVVTIDVVSATTGVVHYIDVARYGKVTPQDILRLVAGSVEKHAGKGREATIAEIMARINRIEKELEELKQLLKRLNETWTR